MASITTTKPIDPTAFMAALGVLSLKIEGVADSSDEKTVFADVEQGALEDAITAHAYVPPVYIDKRIWLKRLTNTEYAAIWASQDITVIRLRDELIAHNGMLNLASDDMKNGVGYLAAVGLIASHRPAELLANPT